MLDRSCMPRNIIVFPPEFWRLHEFDCPFNFLSEFEQWFEWMKRVHAEKDPSWLVTGQMTNWDYGIFAKFAKPTWWIRLNEQAFRI